MSEHDKAREARQKKEMTNLKVRHANQDHYDKIRKLRAAKRKTTLEDAIQDVVQGIKPVNEGFDEIEVLALAFTVLDALDMEQIDEATSEKDDLVAQIKSVSSNKKNLVMLIGNGINRLRGEKDDRGILILIGALGVLSAAGEDATLIGLAKRLASTGLTSKGRR